MNTRSATASSTSQTTPSKAKEVEGAKDKKKLVLKLKEAKEPTIKWTEDTVDNEHLGRKSSKR